MDSSSPIEQFWPILVLRPQPAAHCRQLKRNAAGNALASLDTSDRFYGHLSSPRLNEKVRENSHRDSQLRIIHFFAALISTFSDAFSVWGRTHTLVLSVVYQSPKYHQGKWDRKWILPTTSWCFRWLGAKQLSQVSKEIVRRKRGNEKWPIFSLKLQRAVMAA